MMFSNFDKSSKEKPTGAISAASSPPQQRNTRTRGGNASASSSLSAEPPSDIPSISFPSGGGAIMGMGEKFNFNPATGTATLSVPISTSSARGLEPTLSLDYDSANGNGPFGLGWSLQTSAITRKTSRGIPRYLDAEESDVFLLSGKDDLVPIFKRDGDGEIIVNDGLPVIQEESRDGFVIRKYSPRVDQTFTRIERWTVDGHTHWRTISSDNVTSIYGRDDNSKIYDPSDPQRVFSYFISETYDSKGNAIIYKYRAEDSIGVDTQQTNEQNRTEKTRSSNRYLSTIHYGNKTPNRDLATWEAFSAFDLPEDDWCFTVAFDYGQYDFSHPRLTDDHPWHCRKDPFSSFRSGFEIRTYRLCRRILMFHHFETDFLVTSTDLMYAQNHHLTYLTKVTHVGYILDKTYRSKSLPSLEFEYSQFPSDEEFLHLPTKEIDPKSLEDLPAGIDSTNYQFLDLDGEGISGVLAEQGGAWYYKRNLSANHRVNGELAVKLAPTELICPKPNSASSFFADVDGDGLMSLVELNNINPGFYSRQFNLSKVEGWIPFRTFNSFPKVFGHPDLRFLDVTGDGIPDIVITNNQAFIYYPSLGEEGYGDGRETPQFLNEDKGPRLIFSDPEDTIYLADMTGDGMTDLVRIRNGQVCYWPNMGYGVFGTKITMDNSPWFAEPDQFNPRYLRIADIDGSGPADLLYISSYGVDVYLNQSGNAFRDCKHLPISLSNASTFTALDLLGTGTISLVWSSPLPADRIVRYIDFTNGKKPHLLTRLVNNMGGETRLQYASSTKFYLHDKEAGRPWLTRLPFPVQCVETVEVFDYVSSSHFLTRYAYHHGNYDGYEREYRGFAMVEQWDTEAFTSDWTTPPSYSKTWFHNGAFLDGDIQCVLSCEYFGSSSDLHNSIPDVNPETCRALGGHMLRQEIYADDGSPQSNTPYTVTENSYTVRTIQNREDLHRHLIVTVNPRETMTFNFERNNSDPRTTHSLVLQVDDYGNVLKRIDVAYGRNGGDRTQEQLLMTYIESRFTEAIYQSDDYLLPKLWESLEYQIYDLKPSHLKFSIEDFTHDEFAPIVKLPHIPYLDHGEGKQKRLLQRNRNLFRSNDLSRLLPPGHSGTQGIIGETYKLAFDPSVLKRYRRTCNGSMENLIPDQDMISGTNGNSGGYVDLDDDGCWWIPSGRTYFADSTVPEIELATARRHFFRDRRIINPFGHGSSLGFDFYDLFPLRITDAAGNVTEGQIDYRTLNYYLVTEANGNRTQSMYDELGRLVGTAEMGKIGQDIGDSLEGFKASLTIEEADEYFRDPTGPIAHKLLAKATSRTFYDPRPFGASPLYQSTVARETHIHESQTCHIQVRFKYYDGLGHELQNKLQAEPEIRGGSIRWMTDWTVFNKAGDPVRTFEPFFSHNHHFVVDKLAIGRFLFYDPVRRVISKVNPNHTWTKTVFTAWEVKEYDENDTVLMDLKTDTDVGSFVLLPDSNYLPTWFQARIEGQMGPAEQEAAEKTATHANTPTATYLDPLGRVYLSIVDNGTDGQYPTRSIIDIQGYTHEVVDAKDRVAERYVSDMLGNRIYRSSMDAGETWILLDVFKGQIYRWDSRMNRVRTEYDVLRRRVGSYLQQLSSSEQLVERIIYGETLDHSERENTRLRVVQTFDQAGISTTDSYDFRGNLLCSKRQFAENYKSALDWTMPVLLETRIYHQTMSYDAFNRLITVTTPDASRTIRSYDKSGLLNHTSVYLRGHTHPTPILKDVKYNARRQRLRMDLGNGTSIQYAYNPLTGRLIEQKAVRSSSHLEDYPLSSNLQNLRYVRDAVGNITYVRDDAQQALFFRNRQIKPDNDYTYDAIYRLVEATGREHIGQRQRDFHARLDHPHDVNAMARYTERYIYDEVGNFLSVQHQGSDESYPGWTRKYEYNERSGIEPDERNNRLSHTHFGSELENYRYSGLAGLVGNITSMPGLPEMHWDYKDQLQSTSRQIVGDGTPETTFYIYNNLGKRLRKVTERHAKSGAEPQRLKERIYFGDYEMYFKYDGHDNVKVECTSLNVMDGDRRIAILQHKKDGEIQSELFRYQLEIHLKSVALELDEQSRIISYEEYTPYGETSYLAYLNQLESPKRYRYNSKERDRETGLYYYGLRYYAPGIGRWISCDPLGLADGVNVYAYVRGNPVNLLDRIGTNGDGDGEVVDKYPQIRRRGPGGPSDTGLRRRIVVAREQRGDPDNISLFQSSMRPTQQTHPPPPPAQPSILQGEARSEALSTISRSVGIGGSIGLVTGGVVGAAIGATGGLISGTTTAFLNFSSGQTRSTKDPEAHPISPNEIQRDNSLLVGAVNTGFNALTGNVVGVVTALPTAYALTRGPQEISQRLPSGVNTAISNARQNVQQTVQPIQETVSRTLQNLSSTIGQGVQSTLSQVKEFISPHPNKD